MERLIIKQIHSSITKKEIEDFEITNKISIPANYRHFIFKTNGGIVKSDSEIRKFLPIKYGNLRVEDLIDTHQISEQNIPQGYLPIALDYSDNPITINLNKGEDYGKIVIFELDFEGDGYTIANSLEELLGVNSIDDL
jgi:hypothetical protein